MKIFSFIRKCLYSFLKLHSYCICKPTIVHVKITTKIFEFYSFPMNFHNFIRYMICKIPQFYQKIPPLPFELYYYLFVCLQFYLWKLPQISSNFNISHDFPKFCPKCYIKYSVLSKMSPLIDSCFYKPFIVSEILSKTSSIFFNFSMLSSILPSIS